MKCFPATPSLSTALGFLPCAVSAASCPSSLTFFPHKPLLVEWTADLLGVPLVSPSTADALRVTFETTTDWQLAPEGGASTPLSASRPGFLSMSDRDVVSVGSEMTGSWLIGCSHGEELRN